MPSSRLAVLFILAILNIGALAPASASAAPHVAMAPEAKRLRTEAKRLADKDRYREAIPLAEKHLALHEQQQPSPDPLKLAEALVLLADITFKNSELKRAEGLYERALAIREKKFGADSLEVAEMRVRFRHALAHPNRDAVTPGRTLDSLVMAPIRRLLRDARHVLISPDGALNLVPFGALVDEQGRYLLEGYDFTYVTSGQDLLRTCAPVSALNEPVVFADPDFGPRAAPTATDKQRGVRSAALGLIKFPRLLETAAEAKELINALLGARILLGKEATEETLKALQSPEVLHLATHGFFLPREIIENESTMDGEVAGRVELRRENRLLRSGIALSGANLRACRPQTSTFGQFTSPRSDLATRADRLANTSSDLPT